MDFEVMNVTDDSGVRIVAVRGELDLETIGELRRRLPEHFSVTAPAVIDLSECEFIDSTGLSALVRAFRRAEDDGHPGLVIVARPRSQVRKVLRMTNLDSRMPVLDTREAAVEAVERPEAAPASEPAAKPRSA